MPDRRHSKVLEYLALEKMRLRTFFTYGAIVAVVQFGTLLLVGYFFGNAFGGNTSVIVQNIQYVIAGAIFIVSAYYALSWYVRSKFTGRAELPK